MFPEVRLSDVLIDQVYNFPGRKSLYIEFLRYFIDLYDYPRAIAIWNQSSVEERSGRLWWVINEAWESYCKVNENLLVIWLATAKKALEWDHVLINFHPWALAILKRFDLEGFS